MAAPRLIAITPGGGGGATPGGVSGDVQTNNGAGGLAGGTQLSVLGKKFASTDRVRYVSPNGSDSNDGLSPGAAFATPYKAMVDLGGSGGLIYIDDNTSQQGAGLTGAGIWIIGALDVHGADVIAASPTGLSRSANVVTLTFSGNAGGSSKSATASRTSNVDTFTTSVAHGFYATQWVTVSGCSDTSFNGTFQIVAVGSSTSFNVNQTAANSTATGCTAVGGHSYVVGQQISVFNATDTSFNSALSSNFAVASVPSSTSLTYSQTGAAATSGAGYVVPAGFILEPAALQIVGIGNASTGVNAPGGAKARVNAGATSATAVAVSSWSRTNNVTTVTTSSAHGLSVGQYVDVVQTAQGTTNCPAGGVTPTQACTFPPSANGLYIVQSIPLTTTFTIIQPGANDSGGSGGFAVGNKFPAVWIAGSNHSYGFSDLLFGAKLPWRIGVGSTGDRGSGLLNAYTSFVTFKNVALEIKFSNSAADGPSLDIGSVLWLWGEYLEFGGSTAASTTDERSAILIRPENNFQISGSVPSVGLVHFQNVVSNGGAGLRFQLTSGSANSCYTSNWLEEGAANSQPVVEMLAPYGPVVWSCAAWNPAMSDSGDTPPLVRVYKGAPPQNMTVGIYGQGNTTGAALEGPGTMLPGGASGIGFGPWVSTASNVSPAAKNQFGVWGYKLIGDTQARRAVGPTPVRFANLAPQNPASWAINSGTVTITTGQTDPYGATNAARVTSTADSGGFSDIKAFSSSHVFNTGDYIYFGVWARPSNYNISSISRTTNVVTVTTSTSHGFATGAFVIIKNVQGGATSFNGTFQITNTGASTFTYAQTGANESGTASTGQAFSTAWQGLNYTVQLSGSGTNCAAAVVDQTKGFLSNGAYSGTCGAVNQAINSNAIFQEDGNWQYIYGWFTFSFANGGIHGWNMLLRLKTTQPMDYAYPMYVYIPATSISSDSEVAEYALNLAPYSNACVVGTVCGPAGPAGSSANTALSNLAAVAVNLSLLPGVDASIDLGSSTKQWRDMYFSGTLIGGGAGPPSLEGTPGTCTASPALIGKMCLDSTGNRFRYSYNAGAYGDLLLAGDKNIASGVAGLDSGSRIAKAQGVATTVYTDQTNTYTTGTQDFESAAVTRPLRRLAFASFPGTCTANREFLERSDPATAGQVIYVCNAAGTGWDLVGDGGAGSSVPNPAANGMVACTGTACSTSAARTITGTAGNIAVTNGDGVAGNPTIDLGTTAVQTDQANTWTTGAQDMGSATSLVVPKAAGAAPTAQGDVRYDTTQDTLMRGGDGAIKGAVPRVLMALVCNSTACVCTGTGCTAGTFTTNCVSGGADASCTNAGTVETNFGANFSIPANFLFANKILRVTVAGEITSSSTPATAVFRVKVGTTVLYSSFSAAPNASVSATGVGGNWIIQGVEAAGAAAHLEVGPSNTGALNGVNGNFVPFLTGNTTAQPVASIATNGALTLQFSYQLGTATIGNFLRLRQMIVEELN